MFRYKSFYVLFVACGLTLGSINELCSQEKIRFDVDSIIECQEITPSKDQRRPTEGRLIRIPVLVSADVDDDLRKNLTQIRIDIQFLQRGNSVFDYSPQTTSHTRIQGPVSIEKHDEKNGSFGFNLSGSYEPVRGSANVGLGKKKRTSVRYQELPEKTLVSATGTVNRRSGVYFKFLKYSEVPWDSERNLSVIAQVPEFWRAGVIRITVVAEANRSILPGIKDRYSVAKKIFYVPFVQQGDREAFRLASDLNRQASKVRKLVASSSPTPYSNSGSIRLADLNRWYIRPSRDPSKFQRLPKQQKETFTRFNDLRFKMFSMNSDARHFQTAKKPSPVTNRATQVSQAKNQRIKTPSPSGQKTSAAGGDKNESKLVWRKVK